MSGTARGCGSATPARADRGKASALSQFRPTSQLPPPNLADYVRTRPQTDTHYLTLITDFLTRSGGASRQDIDVLLKPILSDALTDEQKANKISNLLARLRRDQKIRNEGSRSQAVGGSLPRTPKVSPKSCYIARAGTRTASRGGRLGFLESTRSWLPSVSRGGGEGWS